MFGCLPQFSLFCLLHCLLSYLREWITMVGFRAARVEADLGFAEYKLLVQHRESWVSLIPEILPLI